MIMYKTGFAILTGKKLNSVLVNNSLYGNRTRLSALRGRRLSRLTNRPCFILPDRPSGCKPKFAA